MKIMLRICLLISLFSLTLPLTANEPETKATLSLPPASLAQWYKPANKRQVWLHTMFRLRRSMQAVAMYADRGDRDKLQKWMNKLAEDYTSVGDMVPEWQKQLDQASLENLRTAAESMDKNAIGRAQHELKKSCRNCHSEFRAVTALLQRGPDFSDVSLLDEGGLEELSLGEAMKDMSTSINRIVISLDDGRPQDAKLASITLGRQMTKLAGTCSSCHKDESVRQRILGNNLKQEMDHLAALIDAREIRESKRAVGHIAVNVCARCHGIHRTLQDLRQLIGSNQEDGNE
jgi:cytochrome c553